MIRRAAAVVGVSVLTWVVTSAVVWATVLAVQEWRQWQGVDAGSGGALRTAFATANVVAPFLLGVGAFAAAIAAFGGRWGAPRVASAFLSAAVCATTLYGLMAIAAYTNNCDLGVAFPPFPQAFSCD